MHGIASFLDSFLHGVDLLALALTIGSAFWGLMLLQPWKSNSEFKPSVVHTGVGILYRSAFVLAAVQALTLAAKTWLISEALGQWPFPAIMQTIQFKSGLLRAALALLLGIYAYAVLRHNPKSGRSWTVVLLLLLPLIVCGAWLVHGAGRLDNRVLLMTGTVVHQVSASIWIGGIAQLLGIWLQTRNSTALQPEWASLLSRFSGVGIVAVVLLAVTGIVMSWLYIGSLRGLIGTGYGNLLLVKLGLFAMVLGFAWLNFSTVKRCRLTQNHEDCIQRVPYFIESEAFILIAILFTAGAMSSQPPSIDIPALTASGAEVLEMFKPRTPRLTSPSHRELMAGEASRTAIMNQVHSSAATAWSDYNHNAAGLFLFVMTAFGMLSYYRPFSWAKYWPLGFVGLAVFLFFRADAEAWPMGPLGFWESIFSNVEILQHRLATLVTFALGVFEYRARRNEDMHSWQPYAFPVLCAFGGLILMTHSHLGFQAKTEFLIQIGHTLIGLLAVVAACGRWLEIKLDPPVNRIAGFTSVLAIFLISLVLLFYKEPLA